MTNIPEKQVTIYTDGGCIGNPGKGGYGVVLLFDQAGTIHRRELSGGFRFTTNNRMELTAVIVGLRMLKMPCHVTLYTDSRYVVDSINKRWVYTWQANKWHRKKERVPNHDLWQQLIALCEHHTVTFVWVKGHAGTVENERCDALSHRATQQSHLPDDDGYIANQ